MDNHSPDSDTSSKYIYPKHIISLMESLEGILDEISSLPIRWRWKPKRIAKKIFYTATDDSTHVMPSSKIHDIYEQRTQLYLTLHDKGYNDQLSTIETLLQSRKESDIRIITNYHDLAKEYISDNPRFFRASDMKSTLTLYRDSALAYDQHSLADELSATINQFDDFIDHKTQPFRTALSYAGKAAYTIIKIPITCFSFAVSVLVRE